MLLGSEDPVQHQFDFNRADGKLLAEVMTLDAESLRPWPAEELKSIFDHQRRAPVLGDLAAPRSPRGPELRDALASCVPPIVTLSDLLAHPAPPPQVLLALKQFAKLSRVSPDAPLPPEISSTLYLISSALALLRHGQRIFTSDHVSLQTALSWAIAEPWLDDNVRRILKQALELLLRNPL
jgi:hypothetical protein